MSHGNRFSLESAGESGLNEIVLDHFCLPDSAALKGGGGEAVSRFGFICSLCKQFLFIFIIE